MDSDLKSLKESGSDRDRGRERERSRRGDRPSRFSSKSRERSPVHSRKKAGGDRRVFISNVAYESRWQDIKDLFRSEVGEVTYVELFVDENDKPRGCGIVEFESPDLAARAVEKMHRFDLKGRKLVVKEDSDVERDKCGRPISSRNRSALDRDQHGSSSSSNRREDSSRGTWESSMNANTSVAVAAASGNSSPSKWGNTYGLSPSFLESLWIHGPLVNKVFVANLDFKVDEKKLREVFRLAGKVINAEISCDKEGKSRGFGVVEYEHPVEAVQAISMLHNQTLFDRRLTVRMDRVNDKQDGPPKLPEGLKGLGMGLGTNGSVLSDVSRNLPSVQSPSLQQLQAAAVAAQAQVQLAQGAQLGQTAINAVNQGPLGKTFQEASYLQQATLAAPNLANVSGLLGHTLNVTEFGGPPLNANQALSSSLSSGLPAGLSSTLNQGLGVPGGSGMGTFNAMPPSSFSQNRDFDSMSAALSSGAPTGYSNYDREDLRGGSVAAASFNGSAARSLGNGRLPGNNLMGNSNLRRSDTVVVKNLPPNANWGHLRDKFRDVGDIQAFEMAGKDLALIKFASQWEAERAVQEHDRTRFEGRTIDVILYS